MTELRPISYETGFKADNEVEPVYGIKADKE